MSSAPVDFQRALFAALSADPAVTAIVGGRIHDARPMEMAFPCITFGPSDTVPDDAEGLSLLTETVQIDCWSRDGAGLHRTKELASAVRKAVHDMDANLDTHALGDVTVTLVQVFLDPDGMTGHGVVQVTAELQEL